MDFDEILLEILDIYIENGKVDLEEYFRKYPQYKDKLISKLKTIDFIKRNFREEDLSGRKFGDYILLEELGRGGMGIVFLAIQPALSRLVTIKILPPNFIVNKETFKNFQEEAKIIAKFNHPNIVPVYSFGNENGTNYIAMGYVFGISLKSMIDDVRKIGKPAILKADVIKNILRVTSEEKNNITEESITLKRNSDFWNKSYYQFIVTIGAEISEAISYAHKNGIFHGDLKPTNILLTNDSIPVIVDFGLSKDTKRYLMQKSNEFSGTLFYAAPEQIRNNIINEKTDIWSLGVTLYELLTLNNPFVGENVKTIVNKILKYDPLPLRAFDKKIPIELEAMVLKCLEKNPENRYETAVSLSEDLNNYLESKPIKARPIGFIGRTCKRTKRHPILTGIISLLILSSIAASLLTYSIKINQLIDLGLILQRSNKNEEAKKTYERVVKLSIKPFLTTKSREKALLGLAELHLIDQKDKSLEYYKKCLEINPSNLNALSEITFIYEDFGNYTEALKCYERINMINPNDFAIKRYAGLLKKLGRTEEAIEFYKRIITFYIDDKNMGMALTTLSEYVGSLEKLGRTDEALECYKRALTVDPNNILMFHDYTKLLRRLGKMEELFKFLTKESKVKEIFESEPFKLELCQIVKDLIKKSKNSYSPIDSYDKIQNFLLSNGFDEKCVRFFMEYFKKGYLLFPGHEKYITERQWRKTFEDAKRQLMQEKDMQKLQEQQIEYQKQQTFSQEANIVRNFIGNIILARDECYKGFTMIKDFIVKNRDFNNIPDLENLYFGKGKIEKSYAAIKNLNPNNSILESIKNDALMEVKNIQEAASIEVTIYEDIKYADSPIVKSFRIKNLLPLEDQAIKKFDTAIMLSKKLNKEIVNYMKSNSAIFSEEIINKLTEFYEIEK